MPLNLPQKEPEGRLPLVDLRMNITCQGVPRAVQHIRWREEHGRESNSEGTGTRVLGPEKVVDSQKRRKHEAD